MIKIGPGPVVTPPIGGSAQTTTSHAKKSVMVDMYNAYLSMATCHQACGQNVSVVLRLVMLDEVPILCTRLVSLHAQKVMGIVAV